MCSSHQIRFALARTATGNGSCSDEFGYGIVQTRAALDYLAQVPCTESASWTQAPSADGKCSIINVNTTPKAQNEDSWFNQWQQQSLSWAKRWGG